MLDKRIMDKHVKDKIGKFLNRFFEKKNVKNSYRVLLYHSVGTIDPADNLHTRVSVKSFREQMSYLNSEGYNVLNLREIINKLQNSIELKPRTIALTFDDGYKDNLEEAIPVIEQFGFNATFFITTSLLGSIKKKRIWQIWKYLSLDDIRYMHSRGHDVGSHAIHHCNLKKLKKNEADLELCRSKEILSEAINDEVSGFSFPYGLYNNNLLDVVKNAGYQFACNVICGLNKLSRNSLFNIKRTEINGFDDLNRFKMKLGGAYDWLSLFGMGV